MVKGGAGLCGPRYRWEEEEESNEKAEESPSNYYLARNESVVERWPWLPFTAARIQDAYELCLIARPRRPSHAATGRLRKHSRGAPVLPPMEQVSALGPVSFHRPSDPDSPRLERSNSAAEEGTLVPPSPVVAMHGRSRSTAADVVAGVGTPRHPRSRVVSSNYHNQGIEIPRTPERAARGGLNGNGVVSSSGGARRRSVLDNDLFAALAHAKTPTPPRGDDESEESSGKKRRKAKGKSKESTSSNIFLPPASSSSSGSRRSAGPSGSQPAMALVPPFIADRGNAMPPLPFPLKAVGEDSPPPEVFDLTPPLGSDGYVDQDDEEERDEELHDGDEEEEEEEEEEDSGEQAPPHGLEGFVIGDDTGEFGMAAPRVSSDQTSGSLSSLGQPIFSGLAGSIPGATRRSHSLGSTQRSPLSNSTSSRGRHSDHWSSSGSHRNRSESHSGVLPLDPPRRHPSAGSRPRTRTRTDGSSSGTPSFLNSSLSSGERARAISMQDQTFGQQLPLPPVEGVDEHGRLYEDDLYEDDEDEELDMVADDLEGVVIGDSDEEDEMGGEREDSVGLLSHGPSPKSSLGAIRSRANSIVSATRRRGSTGSGSGAGTQRPLSQSGGPGAGPRSRTTSFGFAGRSRRSSGASTAPTQIPIARRSNPSFIDPRAIQADMEDNTFGISTVPVNWDSVPRLSSTPARSRHVTITSGPPPLPLPSPDLVRSLRPVGSRISNRSASGRSEGSGTGESPQAPTEGEASEISEAPSSYVTAAPTIDTVTETGTVSGDTIRSYQALDDPSRNLMG